MKLALGSFPVVDVVFGVATRWRDGVLEIDPDELVDAIRRDPRILDAHERGGAAHRAALELADRLARTTIGLAAPEERVFGLTPTEKTLPKVVYIVCLRSPQHYAGSLYASWVGIYGMTRLTPPWLLH